MSEMLHYAIVQCDEFTDTELEQVNSLIQQLSPGSNPPTMQHLKRVAINSHLLIVRDLSNKQHPIVAMGTLVPIYKPTRSEGRIEDVVVDESFRGQKIGKRITEELLKEAQALNFTAVELTSSPRREVANALYRSLGFEPRTTNVYQFRF